MKQQPACLSMAVDPQGIRGFLAAEQSGSRCGIQDEIFADSEKTSPWVRSIVHRESAHALSLPKVAIRKFRHQCQNPLGLVLGIRAFKACPGNSSAPWCLWTIGWAVPTCWSTSTVPTQEWASLWPAPKWRILMKENPNQRHNMSSSVHKRVFVPVCHQPDQPWGFWVRMPAREPRSKAQYCRIPWLRPPRGWTDFKQSSSRCLVFCSLNLWVTQLC